MANKSVKDLMKPIVTVDHHSSVQKAMRYMTAQKVGAVLVNEDGDLTGIFTKADLIIKVIEKNLNTDEFKVSDLMSKPLISIDCGLSQDDAVRFMEEKQIRHLVVKDEKEIIGMLSVNDLSA